MSSVIEELADWALSKPQFSAMAYEYTKHAVADTLACMIAGCDDPSTEIVRQTYGKQIGNDGPSSIVGGGTSFEAIAALINGTAAHALDYDDNFLPATTHASAVLVPALIAVAEADKNSGIQILDAYLIGLQIEAIIGQGMNPVHYTAGWHATSTIGCIGAAGAVAWLQGLDRTGVARALSVAVSMAAGVKGQFGTLIKPVHAGLAARNAVESAALAAAGLSGRLDILEGPQGFKELFGGADAKGWKSPVVDNPRHVMETDGLMPKIHPCCGSAHHSIDLIYDLKKQHGFALSDVAHIDITLRIANVRNLAYPRPTNGMEARFSMQYCTVLALMQEQLTLEDFTDAVVRKKADPSLLDKISVVSYSAEDERKAERRLPHRVQIRLKDGRVCGGERYLAKGAIVEPFTEMDRWRKFSNCCMSKVKDEKQVQLYYDFINRLEQLQNINFVGALLRC